MAKDKVLNTEVLYTKQGTKFVPISAKFEHRGWSNGFYLVHIQPNSSSTCRAIAPDIIELECAYKLLAEELIKGLHKATEVKLQPADQKKHEAAWEEIQKILGDKMPRFFTYQSLHDVVGEAFKIFSEKYKQYKSKKIKAHNLDI